MIVWFTILAFLLLAGNSSAGNVKKGEVETTGLVPYNEVFVVNDPTVSAALPKFTSPCHWKNNHLLISDIGANARQRCYAVADRQYIINQHSVTANSTLGVNENCTVCLVIDGVCQAWSEIHIGQTSTEVNTDCESLIDNDGDRRIEVDGDGCTQIQLGSNSTNTINPGSYFTVSYVDNASNCNAVESTINELDGYVKRL